MTTSFPSRTSLRLSRTALAGVALALASACGDGNSTAPVSGFLAGTPSDREIGLVVNSTGKALTLFQLGKPSMQEQIPLGSSSAVTPTGLSVRGKLAAVPLGQTASVALIDLGSASIRRYYTFASGNTTGSAFSDDTTLFLANPTLDLVGRVRTGQAGDSVTTTVTVAPQPTAIVFAAGKVLVVSSNLDENYAPLGNGVVTAIDPKTMQILGTVVTGGQNSTDAALGPDGLLYVVNTGDYVSDGSVSVIDPTTLTVVSTFGGMGPGIGAISVDANGLAYISQYANGTFVWNTKTRTFVRNFASPVCARLATGECRGAFAATASANGTLYQLFFGDANHGLAPYAFVYSPGTFALTDSIAVGTGPAAIAIKYF